VLLGAGVVCLLFKEGVVYGAVCRREQYDHAHYDQKDLHVLFHWTASISSSRYAPQSRANRNVWTVLSQCLTDANQLVNCSTAVGQQPRNSCRQGEFLSTERYKTRSRRRPVFETSWQVFDQILCRCVTQHLIHEDSQLEIDPLSNRQPMKLSEGRSDVVTTLDEYQSRRLQESMEAGGSSIEDWNHT